MAATTPSHPRATVKLLALFLGLVVMPILGVLLLEGTSSFVLVALRLSRDTDSEPLAERRHSRYDPELGWVNIPRTRVPDLYGPGVGLHINAQGFRGRRDVDREVPGGRLRVICSGDSFTLGYGVADDDAWCARLEAEDPRLETVNMGQGGYGQDQAYLWYKRDGTKLEHDVHLFAYIARDFSRMRHRAFSGYPKPMIVQRGDSIAVTNTPVPRLTVRASWRRRWARARSELSLARLAEWVRNSASTRPAAGENPTDASAADSVTWEVFRRVVADLAAVNRAKGSTLVLVHLPVIDDYVGDESELWRRRARGAATGEFLFFDLVPDFRRVRPDSVKRMFITDTVPGYIDTRGHYSAAGNAWVARQIHRHLLATPAIARRLEALGTDAAR